jgi:hypothetical protein
LSKSRDRCKSLGDETDAELERRWQQYSEDIADFNNTHVELSSFEGEEVIRYVERIVETKGWTEGGYGYSAPRFRLVVGHPG